MKRKLQARQPVFDVRLSIAAPPLVEIAGRAGLDAVWIDAEHSNFDWDRALACVLAAELYDVTPLIRPTSLPGAREYMIQRALDIGFQGLWVTGVRDAREMQDVLNVIKFPPQGQRGVGEGRVFERAGQEIDRGPEILQAMNEEIFVAVMIETVSAVADIEAICALPGVDAVGLGHRDYALDAGLPDFSLDQPGMRAALDKIETAARKHGKAWAGGAATVDNLQQAVADGALIFSLGRETTVWQTLCKSLQDIKAEAGF
jgi:2-keto-3-deoxy-L-rhamnonate aldolase RhmA